MFTIISDIEREKLLKQWLGISIGIDDISKEKRKTRRKI